MAENEAFGCLVCYYQCSPRLLTSYVGHFQNFPFTKSNLINVCGIHGWRFGEGSVWTHETNNLIYYSLFVLVIWDTKHAGIIILQKMTGISRTLLLFYVLKITICILFTGCWFSDCLWLCALLPSPTHVSDFTKIWFLR